MYDYFTQLNNYLEQSTSRYPNKVALFIGASKFTYEQLNKTANQFAHFLRACDVSRGDRVVCTTGNTYESIICFWGALKAGAVISLVSNDVARDKLDYILKDAEASVLVCTSKQYEDILIPIKEDHYPLKAILLSEETEVEKLTVVHEFENALKNLSTNTTHSSALDIDLASIIYTSGSTGEPKGVMLTHRNMLSASTSINQYLAHSEDDVIISVLPISFDYGLYQMIMAFSVGATLILEANFTWPAQLLKKIAMHKATVLPVVPSMVPLLKLHGEHFAYDLSSVRCVTNTGAALNLKHISMLQNLFNSARIFSMYGLTECKRCTYLPPEMIRKKPTSVGIAIPNTELWIVDEAGNRLGPKQVGQLVIRGATVMRGYWKKPDKTAEKLKNGLLPNEKLLYTGDYCWLDEEGYLYFHGRMDEVLKCRGIKVSPKEVEAVLMQHPSIIEAAIIGVDDNEWGTALHAFIATSAKVALSELQHYCQQHLSAEQRPKFISVLKSLPKSTNGKIDKLKLKADLAAELISLKEAVVS
jgi:amino acid adenylation domain-containing protein